MNIILMGYRCTGKTVTGRYLAARLGLPYYDTDELIARQAGRTVEAIVAEQGWPAFREAERAVIAVLSRTDRGVIALGGGAVLDAQNVENLRGNGLFVWLVADAEIIADRMGNDPASGPQRPSLTGRPSIMEVKEILAEREPLYRRLAALAVDTTENGVEAVAEEICAGLREKVPQAEGIFGKKEK
ncbi:MAG: shikimate kinase [Proteobacteria bacterium]|nr:shikimate kinase [Pseudomonadota bacterium]MBU1743706.1 shikimate kinase [Pseudomonadota bacterium]MBU1965548.1 shikimate kinase [Pseudomonadota bacterium]